LVHIFAILEKNKKQASNATKNHNDYGENDKKTNDFFSFFATQ
jgi:hypothetical protein